MQGPDDSTTGGSNHNLHVDTGGPVDPADQPARLPAPPPGPLGDESLRAQPRQERSRQRVEAILDAAAEQLATSPIAEVTTQSIAMAAQMSPAAVYRYFADKDAIMMALVQRDLDVLGANIFTALAEADRTTLADTLRVAFATYRDFYASHPTFVRIYLRGRHNEVTANFGHQYNRDTALLVRQFFIDDGLVSPDLPEQVGILTLEFGDRVFQTAFSDDGTYDNTLVEAGAQMAIDFLARYALR